jgi:hypothetical protein
MKNLIKIITKEEGLSVVRDQVQNLWSDKNQASIFLA